MQSRRKLILLLLGAMALLWGAAYSLVGSAPAVQPAQELPTPTPTPAPRLNPEKQSLLSIGNDVCLSCHGKPGPTMTLANGVVLDLYVNPDDYAASVHGQGHYACVQCHTTVGNYPHPKQTYEDARDASLKLYPACQRCHQTQYEKAKDSVHGRALDNYVREAAICTDCHTAHTVRRLTDPKTHTLTADARVWIPTTCAKCHNAIFQKYKESVHGAALIGEGNPDVPTCIDCHGVHNIQDPTKAAFRLNSPQICARCHTDPKRMGKYGISTQVLNTYVADFHGTTVSLFEKQSPDAQTNKPVCYDCHGIHDIARVDDPQKGLEVKENLLKRCQVCHPDANANFPTAWLSHYIPTPDKNPLVYYVNLFYKFFIPGVLGGMAVLVALDFSRLSLNNYRKRRGPAKEAKHEPVDDEETILTMEMEGSSLSETVASPPLNEVHLEASKDAAPPASVEDRVAKAAQEAGASLRPDEDESQTDDVEAKPSPQEDIQTQADSGVDDTTLSGTDTSPSPDNDGLEVDDE